MRFLNDGEFSVGEYFFWDLTMCNLDDFLTGVLYRFSSSSLISLMSLTMSFVSLTMSESETDLSESSSLNSVTIGNFSSEPDSLKKKGKENVKRAEVFWMRGCGACACLWLCIL